jgi:hypothetical protein
MEDIEYAICVETESAERRALSAEEPSRGGRELYPWVMQEEGEA